MSKIHRLPEDIIAKIAAGEVIERPGFAVKELIENSIDAHALNIIINIEDAGLKKIEIIDNGEGMDREDVLLSFAMHATSKILTEIELLGIKTLGFRGEALSTIAQSSNLIIKSRQKDNISGTQATVKDGLLEKVETIGMPIGTQITALNLFSSLPARLKFLKQKSVEFRFILEIVSQFALSYPQIGFTLNHNQKNIFNLPKDQTIIDRVKTLIGISTFESLMPLNFEDSYLHLSGFISRPQLTTKNQSKNYLFINGRRIYDLAISKVIKDQYSAMIEPHSFPLSILFLTLPEELVDVNIHPRKEQVSLINEIEILNQIGEVVSKTLQNNNLTFYNLSWKSNSSRKGTTDSFAAKILKDQIIPWSAKDNESLSASGDLLQIHNLYLISQTKKGLIIIDQHAAHERILYEQFLKSFKEQKKIIQEFVLRKPLLLGLPAGDREILLINKDLLKSLGFDVSEEKKNIKIISVPAVFKDRNILSLLSEIADDLSEAQNLKEVDTKSQRMLMFLSCRAAIKRGERLTETEIKNLTNKLFKTENKYTCPHGRPTHIEIPLNALNKMFKR